MGREYDTEAGSKSKNRAGKAAGGNVELPLGSLDTSLQVRDLRRAHVESLVGAIRSGKSLPRVTVRFVDGRGHLVTGAKRGDDDGGFHVVEAMRIAGVETVRCHVKPGTLASAVLDVAGANRERDGGGLPRTEDDIKAAVRAVLAVHPEWSNSLIVEAVGGEVSDTTVGKVRRKVEEERAEEEAKASAVGHSNPGPGGNRCHLKGHLTVGKDGKTYHVAPRAATEPMLNKVRGNSRPEYGTGLPCSFEKFGAVDLPQLPNGKAYPKIWAAHQLSVKQLALLFARAKARCTSGEGAMVAGQWVPAEKLPHLFRFVLGELLPEYFEGPYEDVNFVALEGWGEMLG